MGPRDRTQRVRFGGQCLYLLSQPSSLRSGLREERSISALAAPGCAAGSHCSFWACGEAKYDGSEVMLGQLVLDGGWGQSQVRMNCGRINH